jgi:hypothetical protein
MRWEQAPDLPLFTNNTAAFIHDMDADAISNVAGDSNYVRAQVLTPVGVLDRDKQLGVVEELTEIVAAAAGDPSLRERKWLLTESPEGERGIGVWVPRTPFGLSPEARSRLCSDTRACRESVVSAYRCVLHARANTRWRRAWQRGWARPRGV